MLTIRYVGKKLRPSLSPPSSTQPPTSPSHARPRVTLPRGWLYIWYGKCVTFTTGVRDYIFNDEWRTESGSRERDMADKVVMRATSCLSSVGSANKPEEICGQRRPHLLRSHCNPPNEGAAVPWAVPKIWPCRSRCNEGVDRDIVHRY